MSSAALDQVPFRPPSVGGWPSGAQWLTTFSAQTRLRLSEGLATKTSKAVLDRLTAAPEAGRADALARLLVVDAWTDRTRKVLDRLRRPSPETHRAGAGQSRVRRPMRRTRWTR